MAIAPLLHQQATERPDAPAIIDVSARETVSFASLERQSVQIAERLERAGLQAGEAALVLVPVSARLYAMLLALFRLGAIAQFIDPATGLDHLERCCTLHPPRALIATPKAHLLQLKSAALRRIPLKFSTHRLLSATAPLDPPTPTALPLATPALLTFTSGSTGQPKAALRTHGFLLAQHRALAHSLHLAPGEIDLSTLPIFVLANLASGVTSLLPDVDLRYPGNVNARRLLRDIRRYRPTSTAASPALLGRLATECEATGQTLPEFRRIFTGGAPVFPGLLQRLAAIAPLAEVTAVYGSTEAEPIAHVAYHEIQPDDLARMTQGKGLLAGYPVPEIALRILGDRWGQPVPAMTPAELHAQTLPAGVVGEIVVSGDHVLPGYLHGQGDAETKFRVDGVPWHRTGDAGYRDEQGRLWLLGRCSAKLTDTWGTIYPFAVEAAAQTQPGIHRSALVAHQGQRVLLIEWAEHFPKAARSPALQDLQTALTWAQIHQFHPCQIPVDKRHNAKVDYPALKRLLDRL